jgi:dnd system-associated protein 4
MRRILRASDKEEGIVRQLTTGENAVFKEIWRLLMFAAAVGFKYKRSLDLKSSDSGKAIPQAYFANCPAWPGFLHLMALVAEESPEVLSGDEASDDLRVSIFEKYANGGLEILEKALEKRSYSLDALLEFISIEERPEVEDNLDKVEI